MSESVNLRVVIFWSIFIFIFAGLGIFGYLNQDLLKEKTPEIVPVVDNVIPKCDVTMERGTASYQFLVNATGNISTIKIIYDLNYGTQEEYDAYDYLVANMNVPGIKIDVNNAIATFIIDNNTLDTEALAQYANQTSLIELIIQKGTDYNSYKGLLQSTFPNVTCNK